MSIHKKDIRCLCFTGLMLVALLWGPGLKAQAPYFEVIGATDVELMACLGNLSCEQTVVKKGDRVEVNDIGLSVIYNLRRGKVISVRYKKFFSSQQKAIDAYNKSMSFLYGRGVPLRQVRNIDSCRVVRGHGSGVEAELTVMPIKNQYRLNAELTVID